MLNTMPFCIAKSIYLEEWNSCERESQVSIRNVKKYPPEVISGDGATKYLGKLAKSRALQPMTASSHRCSREKLLHHGL